MDPKLRDLIENKKLHKAVVRQVQELLPSDDGELDALMEEAVASQDPRAFNTLSIAALSAKRPVDSRHLVRGTRLFTHPEWMGLLAWKMKGEVAQHLVEGARTGCMKRNLHAAALMIAAEWSMEFSDGRLPPDLIAEARQLARVKDEDSTRIALLVAMALKLNDASLLAVMRSVAPRHLTPELQSKAEGVGRALMTCCRAEVLSYVPEKPDNLIGSGPHVRRAVARIGRNDPCSCGSGKKYKRCCADKDQERMRHSSDVAGKTREEVVAEAELHLTEEKIKRMMPYEVARLRPEKIPPDLLYYYLVYSAVKGLLDEVTGAIEKLWFVDEFMEDAWRTAVRFATMKQRLDLVRRLLKVREKQGFDESTLRFGTRLLLAREEPARYLEMMEARAKEALISNDTEVKSGFAFDLLLSPFASLGIHCARSFIPLINKKTAIFLVDQIQEARDRMNLPPEEPFGEILEKRFAEEVADDGKDAEALRKARQRVESKAAEVNQLKESLEKLRREIRLQEKKAPAAAAAQAPAETPELRDLREKVRELKSSITERNNERAAYRRELGETYAELEALRAKQAAASTAPAVESPDAEDALLLSGDVESNQPPRPIEFPRRFNDTLALLPRQVGRAALIHIGRIAAGDPSSFAGAIRLKAVPDVMRVRIGHDHRMLFRLLPQSVQLIDLINRRDLERCIAAL